VGQQSCDPVAEGAVASLQVREGEPVDLAIEGDTLMMIRAKRLRCARSRPTRGP
jgi:hypothetical protein